MDSDTIGIKENTEAKRQFDEIYHAHSETVKQFCAFKLYRQPERQKDCFQDTFRILFETLLKNEEIKNPKAWLLGTAGNLTKAHYAETTREGSEVHISQEQDLTVTYDFLNEMVTDQMIQNRAQQMIDSLSDEERILYQRIYVDDARKGQVAKELGITENYLHQKLFRLKQKLRVLAKELSEDA